MCDFAADAEAGRPGRLRGDLLPAYDSQPLSADRRPHGNDQDDQGRWRAPLHHRQRLRSSAAHGQHRWNAGFHPRIARVRNPGARGSDDAPRQSSQADVA